MYAIDEILYTLNINIPLSKANVEIFDGHTHFFSREFYELRTGPSSGGSPQIQLKQAETKDGLEIPADEITAYRNLVLAGMDECGVNRAVTYASIPQETEAVGAAALGSGGRLIPYAMVDPRFPSSLADLDRLQSTYRFRGILLCPAMHGYNIDCDEAARALDFAQAHEMIVLVHYYPIRSHVRALLGLEPNLSVENRHPVDVVPVALKRPKLNFVVAHCGAGLFEEFLELGPSCPNVYVDTGGAEVRTDRGASTPALTTFFKKTKKACGVGRILFGSDTSGYRREYRKSIIDAQTGAMIRAGFAKGERAAVLGGNLSGLLGVPLRCTL